MSSTTDTHSKTSLPPYLRAQTSRTHSASSINTTSSTRSRPHPQNDYLGATEGIPDYAGAEGVGENDLDPQWGLSGARTGENGDDGHSDDWDDSREDSIASRPAWRRPRPAWIYPFIVVAAICIGMGVAPRAEIYINLACLIHPPPQPSSWTGVLAMQGIGVHDGEIPPNSTIPGLAPLPMHPPRSAADEWFLRLQRDIYEYNRRHQLPQDPTIHTSTAAPSSTRTLPQGPLPQPTSAPSDPDTGHRDPHDKPETDEEPPFHAIDPALCKKTPKVQAAAARITMMMTFTMGVLASLTSGFWGARSDRVGRTKALGLVFLGLFLSESTFVTVAKFPYLMPGGYRALLIGATLEGLLGGFSTLGAAVHAYVSDCTPDGSRATAFARLGGAIMSGFACGPVIGSLLIKATGNIMLPFYINIVVQASIIPLAIFLLPEPLSTEARANLAKTAQRAKEASQRKDAAQREWEDEAPDETTPLNGQTASGWSRISGGPQTRGRKRLTGRVRRFVRSLFAFLKPLELFLPRERESGRPGKDWNLTVTGLGIFFLTFMIGLYSVKGQFTFYQYGWTSAELGPYMSLVGLSRGLLLIVIIPSILRFVKPRFFGLPSAHQEPSPDPAVRAEMELRSARLDLITARISILIECAGYVLLSLNPSAPWFVAISTLATAGTASQPAAKSLALSLIPDKQEKGRLFGALSVADAMGGTLMAPLLFGTLFSSTVGIYAPAMFALAAIVLFIAFTCLSFVRLAGDTNADTAVEDGE